MGGCEGVCLSPPHLLLPGNRLSSEQQAGKEDVEALLDGEEDEPSHHGAQVVDDVVDPLLGKGQHSKHRHHVTLSCSDMSMMSSLCNGGGGGGAHTVC